MHKIYLRQALMHVWVQQSAERGIQILTIRYFNSFLFWGHPVVQQQFIPMQNALFGRTVENPDWLTCTYCTSTGCIKKDL
jgi:hypothetical protein